MQGKKVSIIVPVYNVEQYLNKCLQSLVAQTYKNIEIVLVDDGSKDSSGTICDEFVARYPHLAKVIHSDNHGLSAARNLGLENSNGEYVAFVDSDDWVEPDFVEVLYVNLVNAKVRLSVCGLKYDYTEGREPIVRNSDPILCNNQGAFFQILQNPNFYGYACNKLFERELIGNLRFDTSLKSAEDMDFCTRYMEHCTSCVYCKGEYYHYRQRIGSMTGDFNYTPIKLSVLRVNESLIKRYEKHAPQLLPIVMANYVKTNLNILGRMGVSKVTDEQLKKTLKDNIKKYWGQVWASNVSVTIKCNMLLTRMFPVGMLRLKQILLKRKYQ